MVKQATLQSNKLPRIEDAKFAFDKFNIQNEITASVWRGQVDPAIDAARVQDALALSDLKWYLNLRCAVIVSYLSIKLDIL